jgi:uncharacterized protein YndB with AHSA1/START domain
MTTQGVLPIIIQASPEAVWQWVGDFEKHAEWSPTPFRIERTAGEPNAVGSRYHSVGSIPGDKNHANDVEITKVVPGERIAFRASDPLGSFENTLTLRPVGSDTEVTYRVVFPPLKGMRALMIPVGFSLLGKSAGRKRMEMLKSKVESSN